MNRTALRRSACLIFFAASFFQCHSEETSAELTRLINNLKNGDEERRSQSAAKLVENGKASVPELFKLCFDEDVKHSTRRLSAYTLERLLSSTPEAFAALLLVCGSSDPVISNDASMAIAGNVSQNPIQTFSLLFFALSDEDVILRKCAERVLIDLGEVALPELSKHVFYADNRINPDVYSIAWSIVAKSSTARVGCMPPWPRFSLQDPIIAIEVMQNVDGREISIVKSYVSGSTAFRAIRLLEFLNDKDPAVRLQSVTYLSQLKANEFALAGLRAATKDRDESVKSAAKVALEH